MNDEAHVSSELDKRLGELNQARSDCSYYMITLTADDNLRMTFSTQTHWVGWADKEQRSELREASLVNPDVVIEMLGHFRQPFSVIHTPDEMMLFLVGGGNALVEQSIAEATFPEQLKTHPQIPDGRRGFKSPDPFSFRRAPTPKLRMRVMMRDNRRCRVCGRRPDDSVDVELHVHHIRPWAKHGTTDISNLITLCHTCHKGLGPHEDHSLFEYIETPSAGNIVEARRQALLRGISNYRRAGFVEDIT